MNAIMALESGRKLDLNEKSSSRMSSAELKAKIFNKLDEDGTFNHLKAQLRNELVKSLFMAEPRMVRREKAHQDGTVPKYPIEVTNWLIGDHLVRNRYDFTFSVFCLESGKSKGFLHSMNVADIVKFLGIEPSSGVGVKIMDLHRDEEDGAFIWHLLDPSIRKLSKDSQDADAQVQILDEVPPVDRKSPETSPFREDFRKFGERMDLRRCCDEMERLRCLVEEQFQNKLKALIVREKESTDAIVKRSNRIEEELYCLRQSYLQELADLKQRADEWEARKKIEEQMGNLENLRLRKASEALKVREDGLSKLEAEHKNLIMEEKQRIVQKEQSRADAIIKEFREKEAELESRAFRLEAKHRRLLEKDDEFSGQVNECINLRLELKVLKEECNRSNELISSLRVHEEENVNLRSEVERLNLALSEAKVEQRRYYGLVQELLEKLTRTPPQVTFLEKEVFTLRGLQQDLIQERNRLKIQLKAAEEQRKSFVERFKLQREKILDMQKQIDDLQAKLIWKTPTNSNVKQLWFEPSKLNTDQKDDGLRSLYAPAFELHGTYFDTSLSASHLPPELELGLSESNLDPIGFDESSPFCEKFQHPELAELDTTMVRIRALEKEAEMLEQDYQMWKAKRPDIYIRHPILEKQESTPLSFVFPSATKPDWQVQPSSTAEIKRKLNFGIESEVKEEIEIAAGFIGGHKPDLPSSSNHPLEIPTEQDGSVETVNEFEMNEVPSHQSRKSQAEDKQLDGEIDNSSQDVLNKEASKEEEKSVGTRQIPSLVNLDDAWLETAEDSVKSGLHETPGTEIVDQKQSQSHEVIQTPTNLDDVWKQPENETSSDSGGKDDDHKVEDISHLNGSELSADDVSDW